MRAEMNGIERFF